MIQPEVWKALSLSYLHIITDPVHQNLYKFICPLLFLEIPCQYYAPYSTKEFQRAEEKLRAQLRTTFSRKAHEKLERGNTM